VLDGVDGWCHTPATLAVGMTHYPLYRWLDGPHGQSEHAWEILLLDHPAHSESYRLSYHGTVGMPVSAFNYLCDERPFCEPIFLSLYLYWNMWNCWSHCLCDLSCATNRLLRLLVWILRRAWMFVVSVVCCQLEVSVVSWSLIKRSLLTVMHHLLWSRILKHKEAIACVGPQCQRGEKKNGISICLVACMVWAWCNIAAEFVNRLVADEALFVWLTHWY